MLFLLLLSGGHYHCHYHHHIRIHLHRGNHNHYTNGQCCLCCSYIRMDIIIITIVTIIIIIRIIMFNVVFPALISKLSSIITMVLIVIFIILNWQGCLSETHLVASWKNIRPKLKERFFIRGAADHTFVFFVLTHIEFGINFTSINWYLWGFLCRQSLISIERVLMLSSAVFFCITGLTEWLLYERRSYRSKVEFCRRQESQGIFVTEMCPSWFEKIIKEAPWSGQTNCSHTAEYQTIDYTAASSPELSKNVKGLYIWLCHIMEGWTNQS